MGQECFSLFEFFETAVIVALTGIDDSLEAGDFLFVAGIEFAAVDDGIGPVFAESDPLVQETAVDVVPELGFDAAQAADAPFVRDQGVDEELFVGGGGVVLPVIPVGESSEIFGGFVEDDLVFGVNAEFQSVQAGRSFA
jgi:hypothetical protein